MLCYQHNAGHPWQGSGEKRDVKILRKEFGSNKKRRKGSSGRKIKEGKRDRNCRENTAVCNTKLTLDRDLRLEILGFVKQLHPVVLLRCTHNWLDFSLLETESSVQAQWCIPKHRVELGLSSGFLGRARHVVLQNWNERLGCLLYTSWSGKAALILLLFKRVVNI